jgi:hypothetical protein
MGLENVNWQQRADQAGMNGTRRHKLAAEPTDRDEWD